MRLPCLRALPSDASCHDHPDPSLSHLLVVLLTVRGVIKLRVAGMSACSASETTSGPLLVDSATQDCTSMCRTSSWQGYDALDLCRGALCYLPRRDDGSCCDSCVEVCTAVPSNCGTCSPYVLHQHTSRHGELVALWLSQFRSSFSCSFARCTRSALCLWHAGVAILAAPTFCHDHITPLMNFADSINPLTCASQRLMSQVQPVTCNGPACTRAYGTK